MAGIQGTWVETKEAEEEVGCLRSYAVKEL